MNISSLLDIEGGIRSFFASLAASLSFNLIFLIGIGLELSLIIFFSIKSTFAYEIRTTRAFDKLNKWLFVNKRITNENIKEFTNMVKKMPKRVSYNWQQYILYREKAPSEYLTVKNCIENPLKTSSLSSNIRNFTISTILLSLVLFIVGISHNNFGDTVLNASMLIVALITPLIILIMWGITTGILNARKNTNLDELYQNHHLFQRFIDNACVDLPAFIDFTLLFTVEEIEKGIPALREYLENRARKEKEEFDRARSEMVVYEKYDFEKAGIDGSNILERAMNETEAYLSNKNKTLAKISQFEASLESLKKNFDNIQKEFQRKMQVSKENIDRLRQQQEETTSRIESNFLRKQQATEIAKQEREESDFEQQKRRYLVEKNDCEEEIKNLNASLEEKKKEVEKAMLSEYQTFYKRLCKSAYEKIDGDVKQEIIELRNSAEESEEELAMSQTFIKRLQDENSILRKKVGLEEGDPISRLKPQNEREKQKEEISLPAETNQDYIVDDAFINLDEDKQERHENEESVLGDNQAENELVFDNSTKIGDNDELRSFEEIETNELNNIPQQEVLTEDISSDQGEQVKAKRGRPRKIITEAEIVKEPKKRGRPVGSVKLKVEEVEEKRGRGRPRKVVTEPEDKTPKKRGRPVGSTKKVNSPSVKKADKLRASQKSKGRPRKEQSAKVINNKIQIEQEKLKSAQENVEDQINETLKSFTELSEIDKKRLEIINQIEALKKETNQAQEEGSEENLEYISQRIEELLKEIKNLEE